MEKADRTESTTDRRQAPVALADQTGWGSESIPYEMARVLQGKRWQIQDGPFQGFGSPRGKF